MFKFGDNDMHLDLLKSIPPELRDRLDREYALLLNVRPTEINVMWPRCWKIISFNTQDDLIIQGCKQYLSHHQCIISTLLFGLSVSSFYVRRGPVISKDVSALYLNSGIRAIYNSGKELDLSWLMSRHRGLWQNICKDYITHSHAGAQFSEHLVEFALAQIDDTQYAA